MLDVSDCWWWWCIDCSTSESNNCSIPIQHRLSTTPDTPHYAEYRSWAAGDTVLDWVGAEPGQGSASAGRAAGGSPTVWTTNEQSNTPAYHSLNRYCTVSGVAQW